MKSLFVVGAFALIGGAAPALAGEAVPSEGGLAAKSFVKLGVTAERTDYSKALGHRQIVTATSDLNAGANRFQFQLSQGRREFSGDRARAMRVSASFARDWTGGLTSRTQLSASTSEPVFARFEAVQDVSLELGRGTVVTGTGRYAEYRGGRSVTGVGGGVAHYTGPLMLSYRLTGYRSEGMGWSAGHLASVRLRDPGGGSGSTQLWLGAGSTLHDEAWMPEVERGTFRAVALKRSQPIGGGVALELSAGRSWYDNPTREYRGTRFGIGLSFKS